MSSPSSSSSHIMSSEQCSPSQMDVERIIEYKKQLFEARKLILILDLDQTLLHSIDLDNVDHKFEEVLKEKEKLDRKTPNREFFEVFSLYCWTKLRPGVLEFLDKASKLFELHVNTMAGNLYATQMIKLLDPTSSIFCGRLTSNNDIAKKVKELEELKGLESTVLIVDDTSEVWPDNQQNLVQIERYIYFQYKKGSDDYSYDVEINSDEKVEANIFDSLLTMLERMHQDFFAEPELDQADVRTILAAEKQKVLSQCWILFSSDISDDEANWYRKTVEQFGPVWCSEMHDEVTHVIGVSRESDEVKWAVLNGKYVVTQRWLMVSICSYQKANEADFALNSDEGCEELNQISTSMQDINLCEN